MDYDPYVATALRLLQQYGRVVQLVQPGAATVADPAKPWRVSGAQAAISTPVAALILPFQLQRVDGTQILRNDEQVFMPAKAQDGSDIFPNMSMTIDRGAVGIWSIENVVVTRPDDTPILFELQIRQTTRPPAGNALQ